ncbi:uncharacterized protein PG986_002626 [Apiospora aurea]|uniref:Uncharacterized protein n=1 Tax=Apiospora aurea TaxID=335848 RepID=A0ABR1QPE7_9PEZI
MALIGSTDSEITHERQDCVLEWWLLIRQLMLRFSINMGENSHTRKECAAVRMGFGTVAASPAD